MASAASSAAPLRVVSRRARLLLEKRRAAQAGHPPGGAAKRAPPKPDDTPWPQPLRYAFYAACAAAVPFSIGQTIALSPRLREWMVGDDVEEEGDSAGGGSSAAKLISTVRWYWGDEDYVPPVDRPMVAHVVPGHRMNWHEDNYSSLLHLVGLDSSPNEASSDQGASTDTDGNVDVPVSLDNEPPFKIREEQRILAQYISPKSNPSGVKTKLSLIPCKSDVMDEGDVDTDDAGYETECTLPGNTTMDTLRALCQGSDAQGLRQDLAESDHAFHSVCTDERIRTKSWNEDCRWVVSFADADGSDDSDSAKLEEERKTLLSLFGENKPVPSPDASNELRHMTSIHPSWAYFADAPASTGGSKPVASSMGSTASVSTSSASGASAAQSAESLQVQKLEYDIATLEKELKDPSSLRDRDGMYEELRAAKRELRSLKPWWKRYWG
ncbi:hypothetical protein ACHAXT_003883 [Thalassiosira profunda]